MLVAVRGEHGYVVTSHHVVANAAVGVSAMFGTRRFPAEVVAADRPHDLALLEITDPRVAPIRLAPAAPSGFLTAGGFGSQGVYRTFTGPIAGYATPAGASSPSLLIRGAVRQGDSGGPVLNRNGELVGIVWGVRGTLSYAAFGEPLRRMISRIGADQRGELKPVGEDAAVSVLQQRLAKLEAHSARCKPCPCDQQCIKRGDLDDYARKEDVERIEATAIAAADEVATGLHGVVSGAVDAAKQAAEAVAAERLKTLTVSGRSFSTLQIVLGSLGIGGPLGVAVLGVGWVLRRRLRRRLRARRGPSPSSDRGRAPPGDRTYSWHAKRQRPVAVDTPPPPPQVATETHYVPYETDAFARAHQWASEQVARKFPGSVEVLTTLDSLIKQQLNAKS